MNILGIETSCDETAAAVVRNGELVLSNVVVSSLKEHARYGGIIPEIASRRQIEFINSVTAKALADARMRLDEIDAIAVTNKPGLIGSLLVGISFARALSFAIQKPLILVDHIQAHAYACFLRWTEHDAPPPKLPAIALVVSGGHTNLYHIQTLDRFRLLGQTLDDAAGEAFDKVAKILNLGYPGGPAIDRLAKTGMKGSVEFKSARLPDSHDFSFSGVKTAVLYHCRDHGHDKDFSPGNVAWAFQNSVVCALTEKCLKACEKFKTRTLLIGGGVAANSALREELTRSGQNHNIDIRFPPFSVCTDNAAMIAGFGFQHWQKNNKMIIKEPQ